MATIASPSTLAPAPTDTPILPAAQPTPAPVEGITSTQVNVRAEPSTASSVLGIIAANTKVEITGKDPAGNWWQILYPQGRDGKGWVTSQYVIAANGTGVPVLRGNPAVDASSGSIATVQQQLNVRSGPGTGFNSLGTLNPRDVVRLTGKDANSTWLQIEFPSGPDGKGWINAAFVQAQGVEGLPIITDSGETIGTGTPTDVPPTPTATIVPAWQDHDSQTHPITSVVFEPLGTQAFIYRGDVSTPEGDSQDWIQFIPYQDTVIASLQCNQDSNLQATILENGQPTSLSLQCGQERAILAVRAGSAYIIHIQTPQFPGGVQYTPYTVKIQSNP